MKPVLILLFSVICFAGVFSNLFTNYGNLILLLAALIYAFAEGFQHFGPGFLLLLLGLYAAGELMEYLCLVLGMKRFGSSKEAVLGAFIGSLAGGFIGLLLGGILAVPFLFLGIFLGAMATELYFHHDVYRSLKVGLGGVLGRFASLFAKILLGFLMSFFILQRLLLV